MSVEGRDFSWRAIILPVYLPTLLFSLGEGSLIPVIAFIAEDRGASIALAGLLAGMLMIGQWAGDLPAGWLVARIGERNAMLGAALLASIGILFAQALPTPFALGVGVVVLGLSASIFGLARHAFLTTYVPIRVRARALSTLAGVFRGGWLVGPFAAAAIIQATGSADPVFWLVIGSCVAVIVVLLLLPDPEKTFGSVARTRGTQTDALTAGEREAQAESSGIFRTIIRHRGVLTRVGSGIAALAALRASRTIILPLWALSIGMDPALATLVIGISATIDFALFYTSGHIIDRFGRMWGALPALVGLSAGQAILAATHDLSTAETWFVVAAMVLGVSNGLSSGIIMTLGADLAPVTQPAPFLGAFRFVSHTGDALAPLIIATVTSLASLAVAAGSMAGIGILGVVVLARYIPRYVPRAR